MEAEKSHSLPSARWRTRKADGVIQSEYKGLRTSAADDVTPTPRSKAWGWGGGSGGVSPGL